MKTSSVTVYAFRDELTGKRDEFCMASLGDDAWRITINGESKEFYTTRWGTILLVAAQLAYDAFNLSDPILPRMAQRIYAGEPHLRGIDGAWPSMFNQFVRAFATGRCETVYH